MLLKQKRSERGFTLVELLVVLAILALLAGIVGPRVLNQLGGAKSDTAKVQIGDFEQALEMYKLDVGRFPTTEQGLQALIQQPTGATGWNGPYLKKRKVPVDPWNQGYEYRFPGQHGDYDLMSLGSDGAPGGDGEARDVVNWE
ncbi:type II secretion system major pseudopilin GspG [Marinobacterium marinum]|uniref:Type II secretion system core protein G n=1 Tax=Marinobacterium marinum TaxID=2756129 RepID=A0A7W2A9R0_9GAMM|nr:type II secretion system major pseudopilin GspG [Marinobacterium marinum]MBA4501011.1 type II secretion system major pseudopilin GspG [Marinobacterium marinum]